MLGQIDTLFTIFKEALGWYFSYNVPAVYDVLPARRRALRSKDQGWQNMAEFGHGNGAQRNDLAKTEPEPP
jgi:hypothetical protein